MDQKAFYKRRTSILFIGQSNLQLFTIKKSRPSSTFFVLYYNGLSIRYLTNHPDMSLNRKVIIILFSTIISANMLLGIAPLNTNFGKSISKRLDPIRWTIGLSQKWDMFHSIPTHHSLRVYLTAYDASGKEYRYGAGLPSFREISPKKLIRYHYTFLRLFNDPLNKSFKESYIESISQTLLKTDPRLRQFTINFDHGRINTLESIRKGANIATTRTEKFGPYKVQGEMKR